MSFWESDSAELSAQWGREVGGILTVASGLLLQKADHLEGVSEPLCSCFLPRPPRWFAARAGVPEELINQIDDRRQMSC